MPEKNSNPFKPMTLTDIMESIDPRQLWITATAWTALILGWGISSWLHHRGTTSEELHRELILRLKTWAIIIPVAVVPVLLGPTAIAVAVLLLGTLCFREFSRATGINQRHRIFIPVFIGLLLASGAILIDDHRLLLLSAPLVGLLTCTSLLLQDQPSGYLKRIALANLGFMLCGLWPGHLGFLCSGPSRGTVLLWFILCIELNDVFAFVAGKIAGRTKLCPNTSPGKTREGLGGSVVLTTCFVTLSGLVLFPGEQLGQAIILIPVGVLLSLSGSIGDLILSSIKRDLHLKDMSQSLPGHGGMLDRCDSLIFAAPVIALTLGLIDSFPALHELTTSQP